MSTHWKTLSWNVESFLAHNWLYSSYYSPKCRTHRSNPSRHQWTLVLSLLFYKADASIKTFTVRALEVSKLKKTAVSHQIHNTHDAPACVRHIPSCLSAIVICQGAKLWLWFHTWQDYQWNMSFTDWIETFTTWNEQNGTYQGIIPTYCICTPLTASYIIIVPYSVISAKCLITEQWELKLQ